MNDTENPYAATATMAEICGLSARQLHRLASEGRIPARTPHGWHVRDTLAALVGYYRQRLEKRADDPLRKEQTALTRARRLKLEDEAGRSGTLVDVTKLVAAMGYECKELQWCARRIMSALVARAADATGNTRFADALGNLVDDAVAEFHRTFLTTRAPSLATTLNIPLAELLDVVPTDGVLVGTGDAPPATPTADGPPLATPDTAAPATE